MGGGGKLQTSWKAVWGSFHPLQKGAHESRAPLFTAVASDVTHGKGVGGPLGQSDRFGLDSDTLLPSRCGQMSLLTLRGSSANEAAAGPPPGCGGREVVIRASAVTDPPCRPSGGTDPDDASVILLITCPVHKVLGGAGTLPAF